MRGPWLTATPRRQHADHNLVNAAHDNLGDTQGQDWQPPRRKPGMPDKESAFGLSWRGTGADGKMQSRRGVFANYGLYGENEDIALCNEAGFRLKVAGRDGRERDSSEHFGLIAVSA